MIHTTLTFLKDYLSKKLKEFDEAAGIVKLDVLNKENPPEDAVLITLIHIEEERVAKSQDTYYYHNNGPQSSSIKRVNPAIRLNLYVFVSAQKNDYTEALKQISQVIRVFQAKNVFEKEEMNNGHVEQLILDLYPLAFEQANNLWQALGVKIMPSVMYRVRLLTIQDTESGEEVAPVKKDDIRIELEMLNKENDIK